MSIYDLLSVGLEIFALIIMAACLYSSLSDNYINTRKNNFIVILIEMIFIMLITDIPAFFMQGIQESNFYQIWLGFFSYSACIFGAYVYSLYIYSYVSSDVKVPKILPVFNTFCMGLAIIMWFISCFNGMFYYVDEQGYSHEGVYYLISYLPVVFMLGTQCIFCVINSSSITWRKVARILVYSFIPLVGVGISSLWGIELQYITISISVLFLYLMIHQDDLIRSVEQEKELTQKNAELLDSRTKVMISQIQPHFMYNTLNAIYYLIEKDPAMAQKAVNVFSDYLRMNIDTLSISGTVPFEKELKHIETYLWIEKLRFDDELNIVYDIKNMDFDVPALSIQPFVENAIKHGICKKTEGGTLTLKTFKAEGNAVIEIIDDGVGFNPDNIQKDDGRTHVGLNNSIQRLESLLKGRVEINSEIGKGTKIRIVIPK